MDIHIGNKIEEIYEASGMQLGEFAKRINTVPRNVYEIFKRKEIKTDQLLKISKVLNHDFFKMYVGFGDVSQFNEERAAYERKISTLMVTVTLDGDEANLKKSIERLKKINKML